MTHAEIDQLIEQKIAEAVKMLHLDQSHAELRSKLQRSLTSEHRSAYDGTDMGMYPMVQDVFGDHISGHVVYSQGEGAYMAPYSKADQQDGPHLGPTKKVRRSYVSESSPEIEERYISQKDRHSIPEEDFAGKDRSFPIEKPEDVMAAVHSMGRAGSGNYTVDELKKRIISIAKRKGWEKYLPKDWQSGSSESNPEDLDADSIPLSESFSNGNGRIKLISPGEGTNGYYSPEVLKKAAANGVFHEGLHMYIDHPTDEEQRSRPENSIKRLAAVLTENAKWEDGSDGPGLYANVKVYKDFAPFLKERIKDIGVSIRAAGKRSMQNGRLVIDELLRAKSVDFVTRAGAGGKLLTLYEAARSRTTEKEQNTMNEQEIQALQTENGRLKVEVDRLKESNGVFQAKLSAFEVLQECLDKVTDLPDRAKQRVRKLSLLVVPVKESQLDKAAFVAQVEACIKEETDYLKESGIKLVPKVTGNGEGAGSGNGDTLNVSESQGKVTSILEKWGDVKQKGGK